jgi:hypothetical protein
MIVCHKATDEGFAHRQRERDKLRTNKANNTDAIHSCGLSRSSDEAFVMKVERRA